MEEASGGQSELGQTYLPGTASLVQEIDKRLLVVLRDGKTLIGYLRSVDQFANLLLQDTVERIHVGRQYGDIPRGIYLVRGENVALCGEIVSRLLLAACPIVQFRQSCNKVLALEETVVKDASLESTQPLQCVSIEEILEAQRVQQESKAEERRKRDKALHARGMRPLDNEDVFS